MAAQPRFALTVFEQLSIKSGIKRRLPLALMRKWHRKKIYKKKNGGMTETQAKSGRLIFVQLVIRQTFFPFPCLMHIMKLNHPPTCFFCHSSSSTPSLSSAWPPLYMLSMSDPAVTTNYLEGLQASLLILTTALFLLKAQRLRKGGGGNWEYERFSPPPQEIHFPKQMFPSVQI